MKFWRCGNDDSSVRTEPDAGPRGNYRHCPECVEIDRVEYVRRAHAWYRMQVEEAFNSYMLTLQRAVEA